MASSLQAAVTPAGIRDGEPAALAALVERRANAVLAYCEAMCPPATATLAAAEAFARFRAAVAATEDPRALDPETLLHGATRHAAASMTITPTLPPPTGGLRGRLGAGRSTASETCALIPGLLAARADGVLGVADQERLTRHLERHAECRALAVAVDRAEATYASPLPRIVPIGALTEIMLALTAAAPIVAAPAADFEFADVVAEAEAPQPDPAPEAPQPEPFQPEPVQPEPEPVQSQSEPEPVQPDPYRTESEAYQPETHRLQAHHPEPMAEPGLTSIAPAPAVVDDQAGHTLVFPTAPVPGAGAAGSSGSGGVALPRPARRPLHLPSTARHHGVVYRYVLPGAAVAAALVAAMGVAGVFASDDGPPAAAPPVSTNVPAAPPVGAPPVIPGADADADAEERTALAAQRRARRARAAAAVRRREREVADATTPKTPTSSTASTTSTTQTVPPVRAAPAPEDPEPARTPATTPRKPPKPPSTVDKEPPADSSSALPETGTQPTPPADPGVFEGTPPPPP